MGRRHWEWFGNPGHLIISHNCRYHLHTLVGKHIVSTVGEYVPDSQVQEILAKSRGLKLEGLGDERQRSWLVRNGYEEVGFRRTYETMVFRASGQRCTEKGCACGAPEPYSWNDLECTGYNSRGEAHAGHLAACRKWEHR